MLRRSFNCFQSVYLRKTLSYGIITQSQRYQSGYHTFDTHNLFGKNIYTQFKKPSIKIGELIEYVNHLKQLYQSSPPETQRILAEGSEKKIDTVLEYYCKKGKGDEIKDILDSIPLAQT